MTTVTIRIPDDVVHSIDSCANHLHLTRSEYIKRAILAMNKMLSDETRAQKLRSASQKVRQESMVVNAEFSVSESNPKD
jgi:predicted transcriptional regulator